MSTALHISQGTHKGLTRDSQGTHKGLTRDSQGTHKGLTRDSQGTHKELTRDYDVVDKECLVGILSNFSYFAVSGTLRLSHLAHAKQPFLLSRLFLTHFQEAFRPQSHHAARLYEQGWPQLLKQNQLYLTRALFWCKRGMGIAASCALEAMISATNRTCQDTWDVMINTFSKLSGFGETTK